MHRCDLGALHGSERRARVLRLRRHHCLSVEQRRTGPRGPMPGMPWRGSTTARVCRCTSTATRAHRRRPVRRWPSRRTGTSGSATSPTPAPWVVGSMPPSTRSTSTTGRSQTQRSSRCRPEPRHQHRRRRHRRRPHRHRRPRRLLRCRRPTPPSRSTAPARRCSCVLSASASTGATKYRWDLNDDSIDDVECGQGNPVLNVRLLRPGSTTVRLTTAAADAQTSVFSQTISLPGPTLTKKTLTSTPQVAVCGPTPQAVIGGQQGGGCAERLVFGVIEAEGCLTRISETGDVRDGDRAAPREARPGVQRQSSAEGVRVRVLPASSTSASARSTTIRST